MTSADTQTSTVENSQSAGQQLSEMRAKVNESFGQVALSLANVPRYKHLPLGELSSHILNPLLRNRIVMAKTSPQDAESSEGLAGIAIWASVSDDVNDKIIEQTKAGVFPVRLTPDEWVSGEINWLLDVVATNQEIAASVIHNLQKTLPDGELRLHPLVNRLISPELLENLGAKRPDTPQP